MGFQTAEQIRAHGGEALFVRHDSPAKKSARGDPNHHRHVCTLNVLVTTPHRRPVYGRGDDRRGLGWQMAVHAKGCSGYEVRHSPRCARREEGRSLRLVHLWPGGECHLRGVPRCQRGDPDITKAAAIQYAQENIRVNSVHPGYCETPSPLGAIARTRSGGSGPSPGPLWVGSALPRYCLRHALSASDESAYVTGLNW